MRRSRPHPSGGSDRTCGITSCAGSGSRLALSDLHPVILSGGFGTRLWPASRDSMPKQLLKLLGERSSFQETLLRLDGAPGVAPPLVITNESHRFHLADQALEAGVSLGALITE